MLVFGGVGTSGKLGDLWELRLADNAWNRLSVSGGPSPRMTAAAISDPVRHRMVMVGGDAETASDEVWALDFQTDTWSLLGRGPSPRFDVAGTTDGTRAWFYAGFSAPFATLDDLWELDLATDTWTQLQPTGDKPSARSNVGLAHHAGALYVTGGHGAVAATPDTWRYLLGEQRWEKLSPAGSNPANAHYAYATDSSCGVLWLFGGDNVDYRDVAFTTALTLEDQPRFVDLPTANFPPARRHATAVFEPASTSLIVVGGWQGMSSILNDSWRVQRGGCP